MQNPNRLVLEYIFNPEYTDFMPARLNENYPYLHIELELIGGTAAGSPWLLWKIVDCIDSDLVGQEILTAGDGGEHHTYEAKLAWDDGFVANTTQEDLPYREGDSEGGGTPMGGSVLPKLDGMRFWVPEGVVDAFVLAQTPEAKVVEELVLCPKVGDHIDGLPVVSVFKATAEDSTEDNGCPVVVYGDYEQSYHVLRHLEDLSNEWRDDKGRIINLTETEANYWHSERVSE